MVDEPARATEQRSQANISAQHEASTTSPQVVQASPGSCSNPTANNGREHLSRLASSAFTTPAPATRLLGLFGIPPAAAKTASLAKGTERAPVSSRTGKAAPWTPNRPNTTQVPYTRPKISPLVADLLDGASTQKQRPAGPPAGLPAWRPGGGGSAKPGAAAGGLAFGTGGLGGSYFSRAAAAAAARARATSRQTNPTSAAPGSALVGASTGALRSPIGPAAASPPTPPSRTRPAARQLGPTDLGASSAGRPATASPSPIRQPALTSPAPRVGDGGGGAAAAAADGGGGGASAGAGVSWASGGGSTGGAVPRGDGDGDGGGGDGGGGNTVGNRAALVATTPTPAVSRPAGGLVRRQLLAPRTLSYSEWAETQTRRQPAAPPHWHRPAGRQGLRQRSPPKATPSGPISRSTASRGSSPLARGLTLQPNTVASTAAAASAAAAAAKDGAANSAATVPGSGPGPDSPNAVPSNGRGSPPAGGGSPRWPLPRGRSSSHQVDAALQESISSSLKTSGDSSNLHSFPSITTLAMGGRLRVAPGPSPMGAGAGLAASNSSGMTFPSPLGLQRGYTAASAASGSVSDANGGLYLQIGCDSDSGEGKDGASGGGPDGGRSSGAVLESVFGLPMALQMQLQVLHERLVEDAAQAHRSRTTTSSGCGGDSSNAQLQEGHHSAAGSRASSADIVHRSRPPQSEEPDRYLFPRDHEFPSGSDLRALPQGHPAGCPRGHHRSDGGASSAGSTRNPTAQAFGNQHYRQLQAPTSCGTVSDDDAAWDDLVRQASVVGGGSLVGAPPRRGSSSGGALYSRQASRNRNLTSSNAAAPPALPWQLQRSSTPRSLAISVAAAAAVRSSRAYVKGGSAGSADGGDAGGSVSDGHGSSTVPYGRQRGGGGGTLDAIASSRSSERKSASVSEATTLALGVAAWTDAAAGLPSDKRDWDRRNDPAGAGGSGGISFAAASAGSPPAGVAAAADSMCNSGKGVSGPRGPAAPLPAAINEAGNDPSPAPSSSVPSSDAASPIRSFQLRFASEWLPDDDGDGAAAAVKAAVPEGPRAAAAASAPSSSSPPPPPQGAASTAAAVVTAVQKRTSIADGPDSDAVLKATLPLAAVPNAAAAPPAVPIAAARAPQPCLAVGTLGEAQPAAKPPLPPGRARSPSPGRGGAALRASHLGVVPLSSPGDGGWSPYHTSPRAPSPAQGSRQSPQRLSPRYPQRALLSSAGWSAAPQPWSAALPGARRSTAPRGSLGSGHPLLRSSVLAGAGGEGPSGLQASISAASNFSALSGPQAGVMYNYPSHGYVERAAEYGIWEAAMLYDLELYDSIQIQGFPTPEEYDDPSYLAQSNSGHSAGVLSAVAAQLGGSAGGAVAASGIRSAGFETRPASASFVAHGSGGLGAGGADTAMISPGETMAGLGYGMESRMVVAAGGMPPGVPAAAAVVAAAAASTAAAPNSAVASKLARTQIRTGAVARAEATGGSSPLAPVGVALVGASGGQVESEGAPPRSTWSRAAMRASRSLFNLRSSSAMQPSRRPEPQPQQSQLPHQQEPRQHEGHPPTGESMLDLLDQILQENSKIQGRPPSTANSDSVLKAFQGTAAVSSLAPCDNPGGAVSSGGDARTMSAAALAAAAASADTREPLSGEGVWSVSYKRLWRDGLPETPPAPPPVAAAAAVSRSSTPPWAAMYGSVQNSLPAPLRSASPKLRPAAAGSAPEEPREPGEVSLSPGGPDSVWLPPPPPALSTDVKSDSPVMPGLYAAVAGLHTTPPVQSPPAPAGSPRSTTQRGSANLARVLESGSVALPRGPGALGSSTAVYDSHISYGPESTAHMPYHLRASLRSVVAGLATPVPPTIPEEIPSHPLSSLSLLSPSSSVAGSAVAGPDLQQHHQQHGQRDNLEQQQQGVQVQACRYPSSSPRVPSSDKSTGPSALSSGEAHQPPYPDPHPPLAADSHHRTPPSSATTIATAFPPPVSPSAVVAPSLPDPPAEEPAVLPPARIAAIALLASASEALKPGAVGGAPPPSAASGAQDQAAPEGSRAAHKADQTGSVKIAAVDPAAAATAAAAAAQGLLVATPEAGLAGLPAQHLLATPPSMSPHRAAAQGHRTYPATPSLLMAPPRPYDSLCSAHGYLTPYCLQHVATDAGAPQDTVPMAGAALAWAPTAAGLPSMQHAVHAIQACHHAASAFPPYTSSSPYPPPSLEAIQRLLESDLPTPAIAAAVAVLAGSLPQSWVGRSRLSAAPLGGETRPLHQHVTDSSKAAAVAGPQEGPSRRGECSSAHEAAGRVVAMRAWDAEPAAMTSAMRTPPLGLALDGSRPDPQLLPYEAHSGLLYGSGVARSALSQPEGTNAYLCAPGGGAVTWPGFAPAALDAGLTCAAGAANAASSPLHRSYVALLALAGEQGMPPKPLRDDVEASLSGMLPHEPEAVAIREDDVALELESFSTGTDDGIADGPLGRAVRLIAQSMLIVLAGAAGATAAASSANAIFIRPEDLPYDNGTSISYYKSHRNKRLKHRRAG